MLQFLLQQVTFISDAINWQQALIQFEYSDIYHSFEYVYLEAQRLDGAPKLLVINMPTGMIGLVMIFKKIPNEPRFFDATSVYGYNGILTTSKLTTTDFNKGIEEIKNSLKQRGCVSFFNRESNFTARRLPEAKETGKVLGVDLEQTPEDYEKSLAEGHRQEIKALRKLNYKVIQSSDTEVTESFFEVYKQTMLRRSATQNYFFSVHYFSTILKIKSSLPYLKAVYHEGKMVAGAIFITQGDHMYYMFSGSVLNLSPYPATKLILDEVIRENLQKEKKLSAISRIL